MLRVQSIIYRYLTDADFFNINKPSGTETAGGGQSYIDFSTSDIPVRRWKQFLDGVPGLTETTAAQGPRWELPIGSIGIVGGSAQRCEVYQRRSASIIIARQKLGTRTSNRIRAWHPEKRFPRPIDPENRHQCPEGLVVYLVRTDDGVWAGWFLNDGRSALPFHDDAVRPLLGSLLVVPGEQDPRAGIVSCSGLWLAETAEIAPFTQSSARPSSPVTGPQPTMSDESEEEVASALFDEDIAKSTPPPSYSVAKVRRRNTRAAVALKKLYRHTCQITGTEFLFRKRDGTYYVEVHHLIPLGAGGADNPRNMLVLSPQLHKMLHHAQVGPVDLSRMEKAGDGRWFLDITINDKSYRIYWLATHAKLIEEFEGKE